MNNRSIICLVGNTTTGQNLGAGAGVFKCKSGGNNLQFRSISSTGTSIQIFQVGDKILVSGSTGGGTITGATNGLSVSGKNIKLGGTLTSNTCVDGACNLWFGLNTPLSTFFVGASSDIALCMSDNSATLSMFSNCANLFATGVSIGVTGNSGSQISLTGSTVDITGAIKILTTPANGSSNDSALVWNSTTCAVNKMPYSSGGTGGGSGIGWSNLANGSTVAGCGTIASGTSRCNTFFGVQAGANSVGNASYGCQNVAVGYRALWQNTSGYTNIAIGSTALQANTDGCNNIAIGSPAMLRNTSGQFNVAIGGHSLHWNCTGSDNVAVGELALNAVRGSRNVGIGSGALWESTNTNNNIAIGYGALQNLTGGTGSNVAIGYCAGNSVTSATNRLYIANCASCNLIYGEFDNKMVRICGSMCITALPVKTTETCGIYIDAAGKLSTGVISGGTGVGTITGATNLGTGNGTIYTSVSGNKIQLKSLSGGTNVTLTCNGNYIAISSTGAVISGTTNYIPVFNASQNNICNSILNFVSPNIVESQYCGTTIIKPVCAVSGATPNCLTFCAGGRIGDTTSGAIYAISDGLCLCQPTSNAYSKVFSNKGLWLAGGSAIILSTSNKSVMFNLSNTGVNGDIGWSCCAANDVLMTMGTCKNLNICGYCGASFNCSGCDIRIFGGDANQSSGSTGNGGCITLHGGLGKGSGSNGGIYLFGLTGKTSETCAIYINSTGKLSYGVPSGGTSGSGITWTGSTADGVGTYASASYICSEPNMTFNGTCLKVTGCICATSNMYAADFQLVSDARLKTNIHSISLAPTNIDYKQFELTSNPGQLRYGVIAQELQEINPELVGTGGDGMLSVSYTDLLVKEIAYLKHEVSDLRVEIEKLKNPL